MTDKENKHECECGCGHCDCSCEDVSNDHCSCGDCECKGGHEEINTDALIAENQKLKDSFLRAYAEMENTKKRAENDIKNRTDYAMINFAKSIIPVADNLDRAIKAFNAQHKDKTLPEDIKNLLDGLKLIETDFSKALDAQGIKKIESVGAKFDPKYHVVMQEVESDKLAGIIIEELQAGYKLGDKVIKEAMVLVSKGKK